MLAGYSLTKEPGGAEFKHYFLGPETTYKRKHLTPERNAFYTAFYVNESQRSVNCVSAATDGDCEKYPGATSDFVGVYRLRCREL